MLRQQKERNVRSPSLYEYFWSAQLAPHPSLAEIVLRHKNTQYQRPIPLHQKNALGEVLTFIKKRPAPLILDSCCGTGMSTKKLAEKYPDHNVIGIDKSYARLKRTDGKVLENCLLVRGDIFDLWRQFSDEKIFFERHYIFFPNPWPKKCHVKRRIHAHPVFKTMLSLSPHLEVKTNWRIYAEELSQALIILGQQPLMKIKEDNEYLSLFEKKYIEAACPIYVVINNLSFPE